MESIRVPSKVVSPSSHLSDFGGLIGSVHEILSGPSRWILQSLSKAMSVIGSGISQKRALIAGYSDTVGLGIVQRQN